MGQTRLSSIAMIFASGYYTNRSLEVSMDRIINVFGKRKTRKKNVLIVLLYIG